MTYLIDVVRNGYVESRHAGSLVLLDGSGRVEFSAGVVGMSVFPRSSLKPLQAVAMVEAGFAGRDASLALAAASHDGEDVHIAGARATLAAAGLDETALQCPPDLPSGRDALLAWVGAGGRAARICHNCSGKHAAMVATCVAADWPVDTYRAPGHPLQLAAGRTDRGSLRRGGGRRCGRRLWRSCVRGHAAGPGARVRRDRVGGRRPRPARRRRDAHLPPPPSAARDARSPN